MAAKRTGFSPKLETPADLLGKMRHDLDRLEADPSDEYAAWDFFIEAHHIREWVEKAGGAKPPGKEWWRTAGQS